MRASEQIIMVGGSDGLGGLLPPQGFLFLVDDDGAYLVDDDGSYLLDAE